MHDNVARESPFRVVLFALLVGLLIYPAKTHAAEPVPGDACSVANAFTRTGGPEASGKEYFMTCQSGHWVGIFTTDTAGNVGIGTTAPTRALDVAAAVTHLNTGAASQITVRGPGSSNYKLNIGYDTTSNYGFIEAVNESNAWQNLALQPSGGRVGIGTTGPATRLDVSGSSASPSTTADNGVFDIGLESTLQLEIGGISGSGYPVWLQTKSGQNNGTTYPLALNPLGGNVGIGTTSPSSALDLTGALTVEGMAAPAVSPAGQGRIYFDSTSHTFQVSQNGGAYGNLVGGGGGGAWSALTNPTGNLALTMGADSSLFTYGTATGATSMFKLLDTAGNNGTGYLFDVDTTGNSTEKPFHVGAGNAWSAIDALTVLANGFVGVGTASPGLPFYVKGWPSNSSNDVMGLQSATTTGYEIFSGGWDGSHTYWGMRDSGRGGTGDLVLNDAGNVGIGTASPTRLLSVNGNAIFGTTTSSGSTTPLNISFGGTYGTNTPGSAGNLKWTMWDDGVSSDAYGIGMSSNLMEFRAGTASDLAFFPNNGVEAMRIKSGGNVGVGTTSPAAPLHVNGEAIVGSTGLACSGTTAGAFQYASGVLKFCNGTAWQTVNMAGGITPGCGASATLTTQTQTTINVAAGCTAVFKAWGGGGGGCTSPVGGGGGFATITIPPSGSNVTYYLVVGGGGGAGSNGGGGGAGLTNFTGGAGGAGGGAASGVWTGGYGTTPVIVAAGGGGSSCNSSSSSNAAGGGGGGGSGNTSGGSSSYGGGGAGYVFGGSGGNNFSSGNGGNNYAASGGGTAAGSLQTPGSAGDANYSSNAGLGGNSSATNGNTGEIYYSTY